MTPRPTLQNNYVTIQALVKDLKTLFSRTPDSQLVPFTGQYTVNLKLALPQQPRSIEVVRCIAPSAPGTLTGCNTAVEWIWVNGGAQVLRIDGLTPGLTTYNLLFRVEY